MHTLSAEHLSQGDAHKKQLAPSALSPWVARQLVQVVEVHTSQLAVVQALQAPDARKKPEEQDVQAVLEVQEAQPPGQMLQVVELRK